MSGTNAFQSSLTIGSTDLRPEMTTEFGGRFELCTLLDNRINVDFSYYNRTTDDQIFELPVDGANWLYYDGYQLW